MGAPFPLQRQGHANASPADVHPAAAALRDGHRHEVAHALPLDQPASVPDDGPRHDRIVHQPETPPVSGDGIRYLRRVSCADIPLSCLYSDGDDTTGKLTTLHPRAD